MRVIYELVSVYVKKNNQNSSFRNSKFVLLDLVHEGGENVLDVVARLGRGLCVRHLPLVGKLLGRLSGNLVQYGVYGNITVTLLPSFCASQVLANCVAHLSPVDQVALVPDEDEGHRAGLVALHPQDVVAKFPGRLETKNIIQN